MKTKPQFKKKQEVISWIDTLQKKICTKKCSTSLVIKEIQINPHLPEWLKLVFLHSSWRCKIIQLLEDSLPWISPTATHFLGMQNVRPHLFLYLSHFSGLYSQRNFVGWKNVFSQNKMQAFILLPLKMEGSPKSLYVHTPIWSLCVTLVGLGDKENQHKHGVHAACCTVNNKVLFLWPKCLLSFACFHKIWVG